LTAAALAEALIATTDNDVLQERAALLGDRLRERAAVAADPAERLLRDPQDA